MENQKVSKLAPVTDAQRKYLSPEVIRLIEIGYLDSELRRTKRVGARLLLDIVEQEFPAEVKAQVDAIYATLTEDED